MRENKSAGYRRAPKRKVCPFCAGKIDDIDYITLVKDIEKKTAIKVSIVTENVVPVS